MSRIGLAFSCFFRLIAGKKLPAAAAAFLPEAPALPAPALAPPAPKAVEKTAESPRDVPPAARAKVDVAAHQREGALALLALLQREGRFVDFLREPVDDYGDADIGAAVRDIHRSCRKVLDEHFRLEPVMPGPEEAQVTVPRGFDPSEIRLIGEARGEPPFSGILRHHGWRAISTTLPILADGVDRTVVAPAEVDVGRS